jgi:hypothetical protein
MAFGTCTESFEVKKVNRKPLAPPKLTLPKFGLPTGLPRGLK